MRHLTVKGITGYWTDKILQGKPSIPLNQFLDRLMEIKMPQNLSDRLLEEGESAVSGEIDRIVDSPFLRSAPGGAEMDDLKDRTRELLLDRMVLPAEEIYAMLGVVFQTLFDQWTVEPISIRQASEEPREFASTIFSRAASVTFMTGDQQPLNLDIIAQICEISSLESLAKAVLLEGKLDVCSIDLDAFTVIVRRFIMLKEHYRIGRELVASEGTARFIEVAEPIPEEAPIPVETPVAPSVPIPVEEDKPVEQATTVPDGNIILVPDMDFLSPELTARGGRKVHAGGGLPPIPVEIPDIISDVCEHLYALLMTPKRREYLGDKIFDKNFGAYDQMVINTCRQTNPQHALTVADNELYYRDIPNSAIPAAELIRTIKKFFGKTSFDS